MSGVGEEDRQTDRQTHTHTEGCVEEVAFFLIFRIAQFL